VIVIAEADDVADDVMARVDENDMSADCHVLVMAGRRREIAAQVAWNAVRAALKGAVVFLTGLQPAVELGSKPILRPETGRRMTPVLGVIRLCGLTVVVGELPFVMVLCGNASGNENGEGERYCEV
jgi:hypothetical protein